MPSNTKENGFETLIVNWLVNENGYEQGTNADYNQEYAIDEERLFRYLQSTQPRDLAELRILDTPAEKKKFLERLSRKLSDQGVIEILRKGFKYKNKTLDFYQVLPSKGNQRAQELYDENIFSVTRQLQYSKEYGRLALDLCIFLNGLPIITMELKNQFTLQNTAVVETQKLLKGEYGFMCQYDDEPDFETIWSSIFDLSNLMIYRAEGDPRRKKFITDKRLHNIVIGRKDAEK